MIHLALPTDRRRRRAPSAVLAPLKPADYLRLRRTAAGLTVSQVAARMFPQLREQMDATLVIDMLETPGCKAKHRKTIDRLASAFPLDADVYFQLADEPADRHPRVCRGCGCSQHDPCHGRGGYCGWSTDALCTACTERH